MSERLPHAFGPYVLEERIGAGGMAEVFRARQAAHGVEKQVCVKRILPHLSKRPELIAMFKDEAKLMSGLHHEHIVQVFDAGEVDGALYLAMELVEGCSLASVLEHARAQGRPLSMPQVLTIAVALAKGLHHAHTAKRDGKPLHLVHRDVSPHNVLLGLNRAIKLADFGVARAEDRLARTETGALKGKLQYASPEQVDAEALDHRSDQFAFGAVLWEMLTGRRLFDGKSELAILEAVTRGPIAPPSSLRPEVPRALDEVVLRMLARDRDERFAHMGQVAELLEELLFALRAPPSATDIRPLVEPVVRAWRAQRTAEVRAEERADAGAALPRPTARDASAKTASLASPPARAGAPGRFDAAVRVASIAAADSPSASAPASRPFAAIAVGVLIAVVVIALASRGGSKATADAGVVDARDGDTTAADAGAARTGTRTASELPLPPLRLLRDAPLEQRCTSAPVVFAGVDAGDEALAVFAVDSAGESVQELEVPVRRSGRTRVAVASSRAIEVIVRPLAGAVVPQLLLIGPLRGRVEGQPDADVRSVGGVLSDIPDRTGLQEHAATLRRVQGAAGVQASWLVRARTCSLLGVDDLPAPPSSGDDVLDEAAWRALARDVDRVRVPPPDCAKQCGAEAQSASARDVITSSQAAEVRRAIGTCLTCITHAR